MPVVDASAVVDLLVNSPRGARVATRLANDPDVVAPQLIYVEVLSAVHRLVRGGVLSVAEATQIRADLTVMPMLAVPHQMLLATVWQLRDRVRIADAFYVACAQTLGLPLLTTDGRLARAPVPAVTVILVQ